MNHFELTFGDDFVGRFMIGAGIVAFGAAAVSRLVVAFRRHREAANLRARITRAAPLRLRLDPGPIELAGTVDADDDGVPIRVRIVQSDLPARRYDRNRPSVWPWTGDAREVTARPFTLVLHGSGTRVRVQADERVQLSARADLATAPPGHVSRSRPRTWEALLRHGDRVAVSGELSGGDHGVATEIAGYRGAPGQPGLRLRAGETAPLRVIAESAGEEAKRAFRWLRRGQDIWSVLLAAMCAVSVGMYASEKRRSLTGTAEISSLGRCKSTDGRSTYACFEATYLPPEGAAALELQSCPGFRMDPLAVPSERLALHDQVLLTFVPGNRDRCVLGANLPVSPIEDSLLLLGSLGLLFMCAVYQRGARPPALWYEREAGSDEGPS